MIVLICSGGYVFWDFLSLFQVPRAEAEEQSFRVALASMHNVYGHGKWVVCRLLTIPTDALNDTAYFGANYNDVYCVCKGHLLKEDYILTWTCRVLQRQREGPTQTLIT